MHLAPPKLGRANKMFVHPLAGSKPDAYQLSNQIKENAMHSSCSIIPRDVLEKLAADPDLSADIRSAADATAKISSQIRKVRDEAVALTSLTTAMGAVPSELAAAPLVTVYDCKHGQSLPGTPVPNPGSSSDATAKRTFKETTLVAEFYKKI